MRKMQGGRFDMVDTRHVGVFKGGRCTRSKEGRSEERGSSRYADPYR